MLRNTQDGIDCLAEKKVLISIRRRFLKLRLELLISSGSYPLDNRYFKIIHIQRNITVALQFWLSVSVIIYYENSFRKLASIIEI